MKRYIKSFSHEGLQHVGSKGPGKESAPDEGEIDLVQLPRPLRHLLGSKVEDGKPVDPRIVISDRRLPDDG